MTAAALLSGLGLSLGAGSAAAQQPVVIGGSGQPDVFVNMQVLNSLGPGGPAYPSPYGYAPHPSGYGAPYGYGAPSGYGAPATAYNGFTPQYVTRPGTLLYPPPSPPQSHLTLQMPGTAQQPSASFEQPSVALTPPATREPVASEPMTPPAPSKAPKAPAPQVAERAPEPAAPPPAAPEPAAEAEADMPMVPPPSTETAESAPPAPPAAPEEAAPTPPAPQAEAAPETEPAPAAPEQAPAAGAQATASGELAPPPPPEAPAEPQPETAASDLPEAPQTAALTPGPEEGLLRLSFGEGSADLSEEAKESLRALAGTLLEDGNARVQLLAYAGSSDNSASRARRLSLSRALAVRAFLIDQGVRSTRMDVRALGSKAEGGPADRVDILPAQR